MNLADAVAALGYLFQGVVIGCRLTLDANDDSVANIGDPVYLLDHLFSGGPPPPEPFPFCGDDPTPGGDLECIRQACP